MVIITIIGTCGRKEDGPRISRELFLAMVDKTIDIIENVFKLTDKSQIVLQSGGSSFADHVAVHIYREHYTEYKDLVLYLPCAIESVAYSNTTTAVQYPYMFNPNTTEGFALNNYHRAFTIAMNKPVNGKSPFPYRYDSIKQIMHVATSLGGTVDNGPAKFLERNLRVAQCDYMIAFTFGTSHHEPNDSGTGHTWSHCKINNSRKVHVPLDTLIAAFTN